MFRLIARGGGLMLAGTLMQNNEPGKYVKNDDNLNMRSWWDSLKDKLQFGGLSGLKSQINADQKFSGTYIVGEKKVEDKITGWDLRKLFFKSDGSMSAELNLIVYAIKFGTFAGFLYGGMREYSKQVYLFLYTNDTVKYFNAREARGALATVGLMALAKGGLQTSPKCGILCGIFVAVCSAISVYREKYGILEYTVAGGITTAAMKCNLGIRGMISGCITGGFSGTVLGSMFYVFNKVTQTNFFHIRYYGYLISLKDDVVQKITNREETLTSYEKYYYERTKHLPIGFPD